MQTQDSKGTILYIGGFELPDKNAAAHRVVGIAKGFRDFGYEVVFVNALKMCNEEPKYKQYFGFGTIEYKRESEVNYLFRANKALSIIREVNPVAIIAYNYPAVALNIIRRHCDRHRILCFADVTEWYKAEGRSLIYRIVKALDTTFRMRYVHKRVNGVIAISKYLYDYYKTSVNTVMIPPVVDTLDNKWLRTPHNGQEEILLVYAGSPSSTKERLDIAVAMINDISSTSNVKMNIIGITKEQFISMYHWSSAISQAINFFGRISHIETLELIKLADWSIVLRDNNKVVRAGFPTKVVESISCGTPVLVNDFSNIKDFVNANVNGVIIDELNGQTVLGLRNVSIRMNTKTFDYRKYIGELSRLVSLASMEEKG